MKLFQKVFDSLRIDPSKTQGSSVFSVNGSHPNRKAPWISLGRYHSQWVCAGTQGTVEMVNRNPGNDRDHESIDIDHPLDKSLSSCNSSRTETHPEPHGIL